MGEPPEEVGAVQERYTSVDCGIAVKDVGVSGTVAGTTGGDGSEGAELPSEFVATTVNV
jgi:hypothetical protein